MHRGKGMKIDEEDVEFGTLHLADHRLHHAEVVADM
jgi:hypothetical protein